jgi:nitrile hydratase accessory protein
LHEAGLFAWPEWAAALSRQIAAAPRSGGHGPGDSYYRHWLAALESLVVEKGAASLGMLQERKAAWARAARATPHGQPILLANDPQAPASASRKGGP